MNLSGKMGRGVTALLLGAILALGAACSSDDDDPGVTTKGTINVYGLFDLTGGTGDVGASYNRGVLDSIEKVNAAGGIKGWKVNIEWHDYAYVATEAEKLYNGWKTAWTADATKTPATIFGWGTADSILLHDDVAADKIPYISASYAGALASPAPGGATVNLPDGSSYTWSTDGAPFNFFAGTDYSTAIRVAMQYIKDAPQSATSVAFAYCSAGYCTEPIPPGKSYADSIGLEVMPDFRFFCTSGLDAESKCTNPADKDSYKVLSMWMTENSKTFPLTEDELKSVSGIELSDPVEVITAKVTAYYAQVPAEQRPQWVWIGNTTKTTAFTIKAMAAIEAAKSAKAIINVWGFDENLYGRCEAECPGRAYGTLPFRAFGDTTAPGMQAVLDVHSEYRTLHAADDDPLVRCRNITGQPEGECKDVRYVQGYVSFMLWRTAVERLADAGEDLAAADTGTKIKAELEKLSNFETGGLTAAPLTFTAADHRPQAAEAIYSVGADGKLKFEATPSLPGGLKPDWLGW